MKMLFIAMMSILSTFSLSNDKVPKDAIKTAKQFVSLVDKNDATSLDKILHADMMQFAKIGDKLMPFKRNDFVQMVGAKKLGGSPREINVKSAQIIRGETVDVILQAVSHEYDFMYQISLAKEADKWLVVTVLSDIKPAKK